MKVTRWVATVAVLVAVALMVVSWPGRSEVRSVAVPRPVVPVVLEGSASTWFCAARDVGAESFEHVVYLTSPAAELVTVQLQAFGESSRGKSSTIEIRAGETTAVDVAALGGAGQSVMVESSGPLVAEHRLSHAGGADQAPCATLSSDTWYFPAVSTNRDATARLTLFNPFASDAAVDIEVAFDTGVRVPTDLSGIVVPAGSSKVIELGEAVQRREQFSATVLTLTGSVVAELAQSFDDADTALPVSGLRLEAGSRVSAQRWSIAGGFTDPTVTEQVMVLNPQDEAVDVIVQVVPYGGLETLPEPFEIEVPARRYGMIDLQKESRVPQVGFHAIEVEADEGHSVVVSRVLDVTGPPESTDTSIRSRMSRGTTGSIGAMVASPRWMATGLDDPADVGLAIHNPGAGIAVVEVRAAGSRGEPLRVEVPPGDSQIVTGDQLSVPDGMWTAEITVAEGPPVVVERLELFPDELDFSMQQAVPVVESASQLERIG